MSNLMKQLENLDISRLRLKNGNTIQKELERHAAILADCISAELDNVYDSYSPKVYRRSYGLYNSLSIGDVGIHVSANGTTMSVKIEFDDGAVHTGFFGEEGNTAVLLNEGWQTSGSFANVPYLGYRHATHFIERGIELYKRKVSRPFQVKLTVDNEIRMF